MARVSTCKHDLILDNFTEGTNVNTIGDIMNFLEEVDQSFDKDKLSAEDL